MGLNDRDSMQAVSGTDHDDARPTRNVRTFVVIAGVCAAFGMLQIASRFLFTGQRNTDQWNAMTRVLSRESVGWAGIAWDGVDSATTEQLKVPYALQISAVAPNGPADNAGILRGDYIVGLNGASFSDVSEIQGDAREFRPGQTIVLNVSRNGAVIDVPVVLCSWDTIQLLAIDGISL